MTTKKFLWTAIAVLLTLCGVSAQENSLNAVKEKFNNFEYGYVILLADSLLSVNNGSMAKDETSELLRMKAVSQYSLSDTSGAALSFREILKLSPGFFLDSLNNSPKIVSFFNNIKSRFIPKTRSGGDEYVNKYPEIKQPPAAIYLAEYNDRLKNSLLRSIILPGWGHFYSGSTTKGWILSSAGLVSLSSMIYFIADSRTKEKNYLNERNPYLIRDRYDKYNFSNKMKYYSLAAYALVWSYSQVDLLFFSDGLFKTEIVIPSQQFTFSLKIPLH